MRSVSRLAASALLPSLCVFAACSSAPTSSAPGSQPDASSPESGVGSGDAAAVAVDGNTESGGGSGGVSGSGSGGGSADGSVGEAGATMGAWPPPLPAGAESYYVSPTGKDTAAGTLADPWLTIAHASSAIQGGAKPIVVHVLPGTYALSASTCIKTQTSGSASAPVVFLSEQRGAAKIDGKGACTVIWDLAGDYLRVWGFDITGMQYAPSDCSGDGGSVAIEGDGANEDVGFNVLHDIPWGFAAAIIMEPWANGAYTGAPCSVHDNVLHDLGLPAQTSSCSSGPPNNYGMYIACGTDAHVYDNLIYNEVSIAIHCWHSANHLSIVNNTIANVETGILVGTGDGGAVSNAVYQVSNNVVTGATGYGIMAEANAPGTISTASVFTDNLVYGNKTDWYYDDQGTATTLQAAGFSVTGVVTAAPGFVNASKGDYHLSASSPAVDTGTAAGAPDHDLDGLPRPAGKGYDLGAYERH